MGDEFIVYMKKTELYKKKTTGNLDKRVDKAEQQRETSNKKEMRIDSSCEPETGHIFEPRTPFESLKDNTPGLILQFVEEKISVSVRLRSFFSYFNDKFEIITNGVEVITEYYLKTVGKGVVYFNRTDVLQSVMW